MLKFLFSVLKTFIKIQKQFLLLYHMETFFFKQEIKTPPVIIIQEAE
jgi:hypothetical protein